MLFPGTSPQSNYGGLLSAASRQIRWHAKREGAKEIPGNAGEPMGAHDARDAGGVSSVGGRTVASHATAAVAATAGSWAATAAAARAGLDVITRWGIWTYGMNSAPAYIRRLLIYHHQSINPGLQELLWPQVCDSLHLWTMTPSCLGSASSSFFGLVVSH